MTKYLKAGIFCVLMAVVTSTALGVDVYTDEGEFLVAIAGGGGYLLEDFDWCYYGGYTEETYDLGMVAGYGGIISSEGEAAPGDHFLWSGDGNMSNNSALDYLRVDFYTDPADPKDILSSAGWFFPGDIDGNWVPGNPMEITLHFVAPEIDPFFYEFTPATDTDFRGFVTTDPLSWMAIEAPDTAGYLWPTMDHYIIDSPEPGTLCLLALGGLALLRRKR